MRTLSNLALVAVLASCSGSSDAKAPDSTAPIASCAVGASPRWKDALALPADPFVAHPSQPNLPAWAKFVVLECDAQTVFFQDAGPAPTTCPRSCPSSSGDCSTVGK